MSVLRVKPIDWASLEMTCKSTGSETGERTISEGPLDAPAFAADHHLAPTPHEAEPAAPQHHAIGHAVAEPFAAGQMASAPFHPPFAMAYSGPVSSHAVPPDPWQNDHHWSTGETAAGAPWPTPPSDDSAWSDPRSNPPARVPWLPAAHDKRGLGGRSLAIGHGVIVAGMLVAIIGEPGEILSLREAARAQASGQFAGPATIQVENATMDDASPAAPLGLVSRTAGDQHVAAATSFRDPERDTRPIAGDTVGRAQASDVTEPTSAPSDTPPAAPAQGAVPVAVPPSEAPVTIARTNIQNTILRQLEPPAPNTRVPTAPRPRLALDLTLAADTVQRLPFSLRIQGLESAPSASRLVIRGLPDAVTLSRGRFVARGVWHAPVAGHDDMQMSVPSLSPGHFEVMIELRSRQDDLLASHFGSIQVVPRPRAVLAAAPSSIAPSSIAPTSTLAPVAVSVATGSGHGAASSTTLPADRVPADASRDATLPSDRITEATAGDRRPRAGRPARTASAGASRLGGPSSRDSDRRKPLTASSSLVVEDVFDPRKGI